MAFQDDIADYMNFDIDSTGNLIEISKQYQVQTPKTPTTECFPPIPEEDQLTKDLKLYQSLSSSQINSSTFNDDALLTIKASQAMQRGSSWHRFASMREPTSPIPSPPHTAPIKARGSVDYAAFPPPSFLNMSELNLEVSADGAGYSSVDCSPMTKASSVTSSFQTSPEMGHLSLFGKMDPIDSDTMASRLLTLAEPLGDADALMDTNDPNSLAQAEDPFISNDIVNTIAPTPSTPAQGHRRYQSFDSAYSNTSMSTDGPLLFEPINSTASSPCKGHGRSHSQAISEADSIEEHIENTGVSADEVLSFIGGPNENNRWTCLYAGCEKHKAGETFGRKENIKSHVQGHLQDRQHRCKLCKKTFVRQHDLKRHANIHTLKVVKACQCGKEFARADALTRHRQRGMCSGAFPDTPKKVAKRGRPKKASRPDTEERAEKAAKTRERVMERMASASASGSSTHTSPAMQALPMSRQESNASTNSYYSTPPELDLSSSSPAQPQSIDLNAGFPDPSPQVSSALESTYFGKDFILSPTDQAFGNALHNWNVAHDLENPAAAANSHHPFSEGFYPSTVSLGELMQGQPNEMMGEF